MEHPRRYNFRMDNVPAQHQQNLEVGSEVLFNVMATGRGNDKVISLAVLPAGSLPEKKTNEGQILGLESSCLAASPHPWHPD